MRPPKSNIILTGFMASGKSRIGEMLAKRLRFSLFDIDAIIERQQKQTIKEIFAKHGEWHFRKLESEVIKDLRNLENSVIVTGGGAPMCFDNAQILKSLGHIFYLDANLALIIKRLARNEERPLGSINSLSDIEQIKALYVYRRPIYLGLGSSIDVNHENRTKTCNEIIDRFAAYNRISGLSTTAVHDVEDHYDIIHHDHALNIIGDVRMSLGFSEHRTVIITTDRLQHVLKDTITQIQERIGAPTPIISFGDGEHHKNFGSIHHIHAQMFHLGLTRKSLIIALGGGNVGDVAGFASSTYLRGVPFIQIPTTLLSMVDASIGGKTGIDLDIGKNLVGAFYNPKAVIIDPTLLKSLAYDDFACGMAEVIKHAIIADRSLFYAIKNDEISMGAMIERALKVKALIVLADPREKNIRAHLNLGHTFAHAIEKVSEFTIKHGQAVAIGLMEATKLARRLKYLEENFISELEMILKKFDLPTTLPEGIANADLIRAMSLDKKRDGADLKFILPKRIGEVGIQAVDPADIF